MLLDSLVDEGPDYATCRVVVRADSTFAEDGRVPGIVAMEYMAQTIGAYAGLKSLRAGQPVRRGYLLGTRELTLEVDEFHPGDELIVEARREFGDELIGVFECSVRLRGRIVAAAALKVFQGGEEDVPA